MFFRQHPVGVQGRDAPVPAQKIFPLGPAVKIIDLPGAFCAPGGAVRFPVSIQPHLTARLVGSRLVVIRPVHFLHAPLVQKRRVDVHHSVGKPGRARGGFLPVRALAVFRPGQKGRGFQLRFRAVCRPAVRPQHGHCQRRLQLRLLRKGAAAGGPQQPTGHSPHQRKGQHHVQRQRHSAVDPRRRSPVLEEILDAVDRQHQHQKAPQHGGQRQAHAGHPLHQEHIDQMEQDQDDQHPDQAAAAPGGQKRTLLRQAARPAQPGEIHAQVRGAPEKEGQPAEAAQQIGRAAQQINGAVDQRPAPGRPHPQTQQHQKELQRRLPPGDLLDAPDLQGRLRFNGHRVLRFIVKDLHGPGGRRELPSGAVAERLKDLLLRRGRGFKFRNGQGVGHGEMQLFCFHAAIAPAPAGNTLQHPAFFRHALQMARHAGDIVKGKKGQFPFVLLHHGSSSRKTRR